MVQIVIGILMIASFLGLVFYCVKGYNLMVGFFAMSTLWVILVLVGNAISPVASMEGTTILDVVKTVYQGGPENYAQTILVNIFFGAFFGRVLMDTGIAATLIRKTVELGGDRPVVTTVLVNIVVCLIFTSTYGAGAVVAVGVIVLPILLALGVPKAIAASSYVMSVGSAMYINLVLFRQMQGLFPGFEYDANYLKYGFSAMGISIVIVSISTIVKLRGKKSHAWAAQAGPAMQPETRVPAYALVTPLIPVVLAVFLNWQPIPAFIVASFFALIATGKIRSYADAGRELSKTFYDGVVDVAALLGFLFIVPMFCKVATLDAVFFQSVLDGVIPSNALVICIAFAVLAPLGLFRGPLTVFGAGTATMAILMALDVFPIALLFPLLYNPTITLELMSCPTQSWNMWAINYTKISTKDFLIQGVPWCWLICAINSMLVYFLYGMAL